MKYNRKQEVHLVRAGSVLRPGLLRREGPATRSRVREESCLQRVPHGETTSKEVSQENYENIVTVILPPKQKLMSIVAIGGSARTW